MTADHVSKLALKTAIMDLHCRGYLPDAAVTVLFRVFQLRSA